MPAKVGESVNLALRLSLAAGDASGDLDKRLVSSASQVLTSKVEYVKSETFNSTILDTLKHKYLTLNTDSSSPIGNGRPGTPRLLPDAVANSPDMRPEPDSVLPTPKVILFPAERVQLGWRGNYPVGSGMLNVGNTCYLNATLQALFHIPSLVNWLQSDSNHLSKCTFTNGSVQTECLICAVNKTLKASHNKSGNVIKPYLIINRLKMICKHFSHGQQEDAHEFLRYLIENMGEAFLVRFRSENLDSYSKETTPLNQILGGYMRTEVTCLQCRGVSTTFQHFQELLLDIRRANTLDDALVGYFQRERLDGDDAYRCERCHRKVSATKKFSIEKPPHVLCIQLKRFSVVGAKLNKHVSFTQRLDLTRFLCSQSSRPLTYRLVSMVTHMGASVHCGHYTAIAQTSSGHFYQFDDSSVRPISLNAALDTNSYIIMYEMERQDSCPSQCTLPSPKPATVTSSSPLFNGTAPRSVSLPVVGSLPRPGPSTVTQIHKPSTLLPPAKERDRVTFGLQPRLVMHIKNGKVCQQPANREATKSSLVPYDSGDSSGSDSDKKPDMPILEDPTTPLSFPSPKNVCGLDLFTKTPPPKTVELTRVQKSVVKSPSAETGAENCMVSPAKFLSSRKIETEASSVRRKIFDTDMSEGLHVNTVLTTSRIAKGNWQVTDMSLHSPSCHSESSTNSVASSTTSWAVSDVKRTPKRAPSCRAPSALDKSDPEMESCLTKHSKPLAQHQESSTPDPQTKPASHCNGNAEEAKEESEEYEWVEKTQESLGLSRCNGQLNGWDNKDRGEVASHLARHSHQGYGPSVNSWTGGRAHVDREVENERREDRKRAFNKQYDDELDMGRVKKMKHRNDEFDENSHKTNRFDEYRKNWNNFRSSSSSSFYDSRRSGHQPFHNNKKYRNNHYNNGYYRRKFATQHHHQYYSNKQDRWRR